MALLISFSQVLILRNSDLLLICGNCKMHEALLISDFGNMYLYLFSAQRRKLALSVYSKTQSRDIRALNR